MNERDIAKYKRALIAIANGLEEMTPRFCTILIGLLDEKANEIRSRIPQESSPSEQSQRHDEGRQKKARGRRGRKR